MMMLSVLVLVGSAYFAKGDYFTVWKNKDFPTGTGDYEYAGSPHPCGFNTPLEIEVKKLKSSQFGKDYIFRSKDLLKVGPDYGLRCYGGSCEDYKVRYGLWATGDVIYTRWYDVSNPSAIGDIELLSQHGVSASAVKFWVQWTTTTPSSVPYYFLGHTVTFGPTYGFRCRIVDQLTGASCPNFKVRYKCSGVGGFRLIGG